MAAANLLTFGRLICGPAFAVAVMSADAGRLAAAGFAATLFWFAAWSDVADGWLARAGGPVSAAGRWFDHGADIVFLLSALVTYVYLGVAPWWVPASVGFAFAAYVLRAFRSRLHEPAPAWTNRIGHWGGVANYVLVGVLAGNHTLGLEVLPEQALALLFTVVPVYSLAPLWVPLVGWMYRFATIRR